MNVRKIKLKSGTAHQVTYCVKGKRRYQYFGPLIPERIVKAWVAEKSREIAYHKAGLSDMYGSVKNAGILLTDFIAFLRDKRRGYIKQSTIIRNEIVLKSLHAVTGDIPLVDIAADHIDLFVKSRLDAGFQRSGINRYLSQLRTVLRIAAKEKMISNVPDIKFLSVPKRETQVLSDEELAQYEAELKNDVLVRAFRIIRYTGCRRRSLARGYDWTDVLQWDDIDFDGGLIKIIQKGSHEIIIPIHRELFAFLKMEHKRLGSPSGPVIPIHSDTISHEFCKAFKRAGIKKEIRAVHGLRHSAATKLFEAGASIDLIAKILGHTDTETTRLYIHTSPEHLRPTIETL